MTVLVRVAACGRGAARRRLRDPRASPPATVESTASSATPDSVSCSSRAVAVSSTVLQLRSRIAAARASASPTRRSTSLSIRFSVSGPDRAEVLQRGAEEHLAALLADRHQAERLGHAERGDHAARQRGRGVQVVVDAGRGVPERDPLARQARGDHDQLALQVGLAHDHLVAVGEHVRGGAELAPARDDRQLARRGRVPERVGHDRVGGLVDRDQPALLLGEDVVLGRPGDDPVDRLLEGRLRRSARARRARSAGRPR